MGATIVPWTELRQSNDVFAEVDIRGVLTPPTTELRFLSGDAEIEIVQRPRYAGLPENLVAEATPMQSPAGVNGGAMPGLSFDTAAGWHPLIWESNTLFSAIRGWSDPKSRCRSSSARSRSRPMMSTCARCCSPGSKRG